MGQRRKPPQAPSSKVTPPLVCRWPCSHLPTTNLLSAEKETEAQREEVIHVALRETSSASEDTTSHHGEETEQVLTSEP